MDFSYSRAEDEVVAPGREGANRVIELSAVRDQRAEERRRRVAVQWLPAGWAPTLVERASPSSSAELVDSELVSRWLPRAGVLVSPEQIQAVAGECPQSGARRTPFIFTRGRKLIVAAAVVIVAAVPLVGGGWSSRALHPTGAGLTARTHGAPTAAVATPGHVYRVARLAGQRHAASPAARHAGRPGSSALITGAPAATPGGTGVAGAAPRTASSPPPASASPSAPVHGSPPPASGGNPSPGGGGGSPGGGGPAPGSGGGGQAPGSGPSGGPAPGPGPSGQPSIVDTATGAVQAVVSTAPGIPPRLP